MNFERMPQENEDDSNDLFPFDDVSMLFVFLTLSLGCCLCGAMLTRWYMKRSSNQFPMYTNAQAIRGGRTSDSLNSIPRSSTSRSSAAANLPMIISLKSIGAPKGSQDTTNGSFRTLPLPEEVDETRQAALRSRDESVKRAQQSTFGAKDLKARNSMADYQRNIIENIEDKI